MGWKKLKEHYRIEHIVQVTKKGICIGSPYIHDIIIIGIDGEIKKSYTSSNEKLMRYQKEFDADPGMLRRMINEPDEFKRSISVFTYDGGEIIEKFCEELGWPNITHDGCLMYENTFSTDKSIVIEWAKRNAESYIKNLEMIIKETEEKLAKQREWLNEEIKNLEKLNHPHP